MAATGSLDQPFDYIVIGGGTAGLVVANRLTEDTNVRVLVVEAGADRTADPLVLTPGLVGALYGKDEYDWNFCSPPQVSNIRQERLVTDIDVWLQPTLKNRCINQSRGKMLGGSSALNFLMLMYPPKGNIDAWAALGNSSWNYESLAPYFRKFATVHPPPQSARDLLGLTYLNEDLAKGDGPIHVSYSEGYGVTNKAWMKTFADLGLEISSDPRDGKALGAFQNHASIDPDTHTRSYACTGYYTPEVAKRPNLVVLTETLVDKILFDTTSGDDAVATGVEIITKDGQKRQVSASTEVILAAGALQTPQILEVSGIGGRDLLEKHGIPVIVENLNVGEHLQDHPIVCQSFEVADGVPSGDVLRDPNVLQALIGMYQTGGGAGPLGQSIISVAYAPLVDGTGIVSPEAKAALFSQHEPNLTTPDAKVIRRLVESPTEPAFQYLLFPSQVSIPDHPTSMAHYITPVLPENYITVMTILNQPLSRGSVHITSADIKAAPRWEPNYNANPLDMELLARAVQFVERIVDPATPFGQVLKQGGKRQPELRADDLETAREIVRQRQISVFHVAGSCAMRPRDQGGVVDERLRVYGTKRLRVVDASVFPIEPVGNIQSVVYAVAERAADLIREDRARVM
jgi:choline dehydrogenase-like flavoprotein